MLQGLPALMATGRSSSYYYLLDIYPNATAAYSMFKLKSSYTGYCMKVRRSSDDTEQDIGFVNNYLDTASLLSFVGANSGYISKWYDQSGNVNDAVQATNANQPRIVNSGTLDSFNGRAMYKTLDGTLMTLPVPNIAGNSTVNYFEVANHTYGNYINISGHTNLGSYLYIAEANSSTSIYSNSGTPSMYSLRWSSFSGTTKNDVLNYQWGNRVLNLNFDASGWTICWPYGYNFGPYLLNQSVGELLFWTSDQSSNRDGILENINTRWKVHEYMVNKYPEAKLALSLRKINSIYTGNCIRVRRSNDDAEQDIGFTNEILDIASLTSFVGANSGYIVTWYDQSGNGYNATQSTTAYQPLIINAGTIQYVNFKPTLYFDGTNDGLVVSSLPLKAYISLFAVVNLAFDKPLFFEHSVDANSNDGFYFYGSANCSWYFTRTSAHSAIGTNGWASGGTSLCSLIYNGSGAYYRNGSVVSNGTVNGSAVSNTSTTKDFYIYNRANTTAIGGNYLSELIIYEDDKTVNRTTIEQDLNSYYTIY